MHDTDRETYNTNTQCTTQIGTHATQTLNALHGSGHVQHKHSKHDTDQDMYNTNTRCMTQIGTRTT